MDDVRNRCDVESTSGDIGSEEDGVWHRLEAIECLETLSLLHAGVNGDDVETEELEKRVESTNTID